MYTTELNPVQKIISAANDLMKTRGRARGALVTPDGCFCPIGALFAVRTGNYAEETLVRAMASVSPYDDTPDVVAVAQAVYEHFGVDPAYTLVDFKRGSRKSGWIHAYNDETINDAVIFSIMERAVEIAGVPA